MSDVVVVGSGNVDLFVRVEAIPAPGETVLADGPERRAGGKGLNQAAAAAKAGAVTRFVGAVGTDDGGEFLLDAAAGAGVDIAAVRRVVGVSGTAWIPVQPDGENAIIVIGGANLTVTELTRAEQEIVAGANVLLTQLETPISAVIQAVQVAAASGTTVVLNASPVRELPRELLEATDVLVVNEHEVSALGGVEALTVPTVVVTRGGDGVLIADREGEHVVPAIRAEVVDTTGAGDTFAGYLAAELAKGLAMTDAVKRAVVAGAIAVERAGALQSVPSAADVDDRMEKS